MREDRTVEPMTARRTLGCLLIAALGACSAGATGTTRFETWANPVEVAPVQRLVVFESVESPYFNHNLHKGFVAGLRQRFASCGVQARVEQLAALELDRAKHITGAIESFHAGAALVIDAGGGQRRTGRGPDQDSLTFGVKLVDVATQQIKWAGSARLEREQSWRTDDVGSGVRFATSVVERMRDDGVLTSCPAADAAWPEVDTSASEPAVAHEPAEPSFGSRLEVASAPPVKRVMVYEDADTPPLEPAMHAAFTAELAHRLEACGLAAQVTTAVGRATDPAEMAASAGAFSADTALVVRQAGGNIVHGGTGDLVFDLRLIELGSHAVTWRARMKLGFASPRSSSDAAASGHDFAADIVTRLRDDHALAGCPR